MFCKYKDSFLPLIREFLIKFYLFLSNVWSNLCCFTWFYFFSLLFFLQFIKHSAKSEAFLHTNCSILWGLFPLRNVYLLVCDWFSISFNLLMSVCLSNLRYFFPHSTIIVHSNLKTFPTCHVSFSLTDHWIKKKGEKAE